MTACSPLAVISLQPHSWRLPPTPSSQGAWPTPPTPAVPIWASPQVNTPCPSCFSTSPGHSSPQPLFHSLLLQSRDRKIMSILPLKKLRPRKVTQTVGSRAPPRPRSAACKSNPLSQCPLLPLPRLLGGGGDSTRAMTEGPQGLPCHLHPRASSALGPRLTPDCGP